MAINVQNIERFKFIAHKIIPLVYDDSLSYYEFLCKVMQKLNEVISSLDNQNEILKEFDKEILDWETSTDNKYNQFVSNINTQFEAFKQGEVAARTAFENSVNEQWDEFFNKYLETLGIVQSTGRSTTDVMSQKTVTDVFNNVIADEYSTSSTYVAGDYCMNDGKLYKCNTDISTPETWIWEHWTEVDVTNEINGVKSDLDILNQGGLIIKEDFISQQINEWLNEHPEATTTVQDGSLTRKKFANGVLPYVTPEMFGAVGDGIVDDTAAIQQALQSGLPVVLTNIYGISNTLTLNEGTKIIGKNNNINSGSEYNVGIKAISIFTGMIKANNSVYIENIMIDCNNKVEYGIFTDDNIYRCINLSLVYITSATTANYHINAFLSSIHCCFAKHSPIGFNMNPLLRHGLTTMIMDGCYSDFCDIGFKINRYVYSTLTSCACDHAVSPYVLFDCCISLISCGCEGVTGTTAINVDGNSVDRYVKISNFYLTGNEQNKVDLINVTGTMNFVDIESVAVGDNCNAKMFKTTGNRNIIRLNPSIEVARGSGNIVSGNLLRLSDTSYVHNGITFTVTDGIVVCSGNLENSQMPAVAVIAELTLSDGLYIFQSKKRNISNNIELMLSTDNNAEISGTIAEATSIVIANTGNYASNPIFLKAVIRSDKYTESGNELYPALIKC